MSETTERPRPLSVQLGDVRVGDVMNSNSLYRDEDESQGAVCEGLERQGTLVTATWRITATGEVFTQTRTTMTPMCLMRRAAPVSPRDVLWDALGIDPDRISREEFDACMDAYDQARSAGPVRPDEEPT
jgi:hypothetical protein